MIRTLSLLLVLLALVLFLPFNSKNQSTFAAGTCGTPPPAASPRAQGLVTAPNIGNSAIFYVDSQGRCIIDLKTAFAPYKIPTYADLKSFYFTQQVTATKSPASTDTTISPVADNTVYNYTNAGGAVIGPSTFNYTGTSVIFVDHSLTIDGNIVGNDASGLVIVTGGDIKISASVTQIDAVLIAEGAIFTAGPNCNTSSVGNVSQLKVNGSLISLNPASPIKFCRTLSNNNIPAEQINDQPKYLILLRKIIYQNLQKWSELTQ